MSERPFSYDPYAPPEEPRPQQPPGAVSGALKAIGIIAIILGGIGAPSALLEMLGLFVGQQMQSAFLAEEALADDPTMQLQKELQQRLATVKRRFLPATVVTVSTRLVVAVLLLTGGIMLLATRSAGPAVLTAGCALGVVYELGSSALRVVVQLANIRMLRELADLFEGARGGAQPAPEMFSQIMTVIMLAGLVFGTLFSLAKIIFYVIAFIYVRKPVPTPADA